MATRKQEKANQKYMDDRFEDEYNSDIDILIDSLQSNLNEIGDMSELSTADLSGHSFTYLTYSQFEYAERNEQRRQEIVAHDSSYTLDMLEQMSNDNMTDLHILLKGQQDAKAELAELEKELA